MDKPPKQPPEYAKPALEDYGTVQDVTAATGGSFRDVPAGGGSVP
jgi:hypothetical protein